MACRHFIDSGYTKIGYIGGDTSVQTGRERFAGFIKAMNEGNVPVNQKWLKEGDFSRESGEQSMEELIRAGTVPDALVVANDLMAVGALQACRARGPWHPRDIAIIGMDNTALSTCTNPELSSIAMKEEDIGRHAATLLMQRILEGRTEKRTIRLQPELILRDQAEGDRIDLSGKPPVWEALSLSARAVSPHYLFYPAC